MKKKLVMIITLICLVLMLVACSGTTPSEKPEGDEGKTETESESIEHENEKKTDYVSIDGVYVNDAYVSEDNPTLKMVYVFYDVHTDDVNLKVSSVADLKSAANTYQFEGYPSNKVGQNYMSNYHYGRTIVDVYSGENAKFLSTFRVPENDISEDSTLHIVNSDVPDIETIEITGDSIKHCKSYKEIAKAVDPKGYKKEVKLQKKANEETTAKVQNGINGYKWDFYTNNMSMTIEFFEPNQFTLSALGSENSGSYYVKNGYVCVKYDSNGETIDIPWYVKDGEIEIKPQDAYAIP